MKIRLSVLFGIIGYFVFISLLVIIVPYSVTFNKVIAICVLVLSCIYVYRCKNNFLLLCMSMFIAYSNYSIVMGAYIYPELRPVMYAQIDDVKVYGIAINLILLVMFTLVIFQHKSIEKSNSFAESFVRKENFNNLLFIIATVVFLIIWVVGYSRSDDGRGTVSPIYEYNSIFLIIMYFYSGNRKYLNYICYFCTALYVYTSISNGTRIEAIICLLVVLFCSVRKKISIKSILLVGFAGIIVMNVVGALRGNYESILVGINEVIKTTIDEKLVFDTPVHAFFPAMCMVEKSLTYTFLDARHFLWRFLLSIFAGNNRIEDGNLISVMRQYYYHNFGGVTVGFFYVWFSFLGPVIYGKIISIFSNIVVKSDEYKSDLLKCITIYFVANVPRWYLYGPSTMFRGVLICGIVFIGFVMIANVMKKYSNNVR